jgi:hypothetical protein
MDCWQLQQSEAESCATLQVPTVDAVNDYARLLRCCALLCCGGDELPSERVMILRMVP